MAAWARTAHRREVLKREVEWWSHTAVTDGVQSERFGTFPLCKCCCIPRMWIMLGSDDGHAVDGVHGVRLEKLKASEAAGCAITWS